METSLLFLLVLTAAHALPESAEVWEDDPQTDLGVTDKELSEISEALHGLDVNRGRPGIDFVVHPRGPKLFTKVSPALLQRPTYAALRAVQNIYTPQTGAGRDEPACPPCAPEENKFMDTVMKTSVMKKAHEFLSSKGLASPTMYGFRAQVRQWWFHKFSRSKGKALDSSGFEHVFAVDLKGTKVGGYHNWVYFHEGEKHKTTKYIQFQKNCKPNVLTCRFSYKNHVKPIGGFFIGTSPEFDLAIKTVCFRARKRGLCKITLGGNHLSIQTYAMSGHQPLTISTAYPLC